MKTLILWGLVLGALGLSACGRKGDLMPPPGYEEKHPNENQGQGDR